MNDKRESCQSIIWGLTVGALFLMLVIAFAWNVHMKLQRIDISVRVTDLTWRYYLNVEQFSEVYQDTLKSYMPSDAYNITFYDTKSCVNVSDVPVCSKTYHAKYWIQRWVYAYTLTNEGNPGQEMQYPDFVPNGNGELGSKRESTRGKTFFVTFKSEEMDYAYQTDDYATWKVYRVEGIHTMKVNGFKEPLWDTLQ